MKLVQVPGKIFINPEHIVDITIEGVTDVDFSTQQVYQSYSVYCELVTNQKIWLTETKTEKEAIEYIQNFGEVISPTGTSSATP